MSQISTQVVQNEVESNLAVLLYFYSDHCAPCISLRPKVETLLQSNFPHMKLILVDSEKHPEITAQYSVFSNPTLLLFFDGREHHRLSKYVGIPQLHEAINRPYQLIFD